MKYYFPTNKVSPDFADFLTKEEVVRLYIDLHDAAVEQMGVNL